MTTTASRSARRDAVIEFPANPFVALADFVVVLVLVLMLAFVHQALSNSRLLERIAVDQAQRTLLNKATKQQAADASLKRYYVEGSMPSDRAALVFDPNSPRFFQLEPDGDLQRFRLDNIFQKSLATGSYDTISTTGTAMLHDLGQVLQPYQGNLDEPGTGLFKRVIVEGHADSAEGTSDEQTWALSLSRALKAERQLESGGLSPKVIEVSGRGVYYPAVYEADEPNKQLRIARNRYLDIIVVFSGERTLKYGDQNKGKSLR